jgi:hypothetical protein
MRLRLAAIVAGLVLATSLQALAARGTEEDGRAAPMIEMAALPSPAVTPTSGCGEPSEIGANEDCTLALDDEVMLAAELLITKLGPAALDFALERAERHKANEDTDAADLWRRIADTLGEMASLSRASVSKR